MKMKVIGGQDVQGHERYTASVEDKGGQAGCGQLDHGLLNGRIKDLIETAKLDSRAGLFFSYELI